LMIILSMKSDKSPLHQSRKQRVNKTLFYESDVNNLDCQQALESEINS